MMFIVTWDDCMTLVPFTWPILDIWAQYWANAFMGEISWALNADQGYKVRYDVYMSYF